MHSATDNTFSLQRRLVFRRTVSKAANFGRSGHRLGSRDNAVQSFIMTSLGMPVSHKVA
jgi:hypothetical protein